MGLLDSIFGGGSNKQSGSQTTTGSSKTSSQGAKTGATTTQTGTTSAQTGQTATEQTQEQRALAPEVENLLIGLIGQLGQGGGAEGATGDEAKAVAENLLTRAGGTQAFVEGETAAIVDAARQSGQRNVDAQTTRNVRQAGSSFNTLAQQSAQLGQNELETSLAGLSGELALGGREQETAALAQAFDALTKSGELGAGAGLESTRVIGDLVNSLKGATTTTTGSVDTTTSAEAEQQTTENSVQQLLEQIEQLTKTSRQTQQRGKVETNPTGLDIIGTVGQLLLSD